MGSRRCRPHYPGSADVVAVAAARDRRSPSSTAKSHQTAATGGLQPIFATSPQVEATADCCGVGREEEEKEEESGAGEVLGHLAIIIAAACNREPVGGCRYRSRRLGPIDATPLHADLTYVHIFSIPNMCKWSVGRPMISQY